MERIADVANALPDPCESGIFQIPPGVQNAMNSHATTASVLSGTAFACAKQTMVKKPRGFPGNNYATTMQQLCNNPCNNSMQQFDSLQFCSEIARSGKPR